LGFRAFLSTGDSCHDAFRESVQGDPIHSAILGAETVGRKSRQSDRSLMPIRPFGPPHHGLSDTGLVAGGTMAQPEALRRRTSVRPTCEKNPPNAHLISRIIEFRQFFIFLI
jgi:hypothetical protein